MLSLGAAAFTLERGLLTTFSVNLETLPGAAGDPDTMKWWEGQPEAWEAARTNLKTPEQAMDDFSTWVSLARDAAMMRLSGQVKPVFVGYPAGFDFLFVYWYLINFTGESPFSFSAIDIKTYAMALLDLGYRDSTKKNMPKEWFSDRPHGRNCRVEVGWLFLGLLRR